MPEPIKPSKTEAGNGWEDSALRDYISDRNKAASLRIFGDPSVKKKRPVRIQNCKRFNAHKW